MQCLTIMPMSIRAKLRVIELASLDVVPHRTASHSQKSGRVSPQRLHTQSKHRFFEQILELYRAVIVDSALWWLYS